MILRSGLDFLFFFYFIFPEFGGYFSSTAIMVDALIYLQLHSLLCCSAYKPQSDGLKPYKRPHLWVW